jgi:hypothetical protein
MALKKTFEIAGLTVTDGYLRVSNVHGTKNSMAYSIAFQASVDNDPLRQESFSFVPDMNGPNFIKQAYENLKSLEGYKDAVDC